MLEHPLVRSNRRKVKVAFANGFLVGVLFVATIAYLWRGI